MGAFSVAPVQHNHSDCVLKPLKHPIQRMSKSVDSSGNSGLHYAAGYGRRELLEYLLKVGRGEGGRGMVGAS